MIEEYVCENSSFMNINSAFIPLKYKCYSWLELMTQSLASLSPLALLLKFHLLFSFFLPLSHSCISLSPNIYYSLLMLLSTCLPLTSFRSCDLLCFSLSNTLHLSLILASLSLFSKCKSSNSLFHHKEYSQWPIWYFSSVKTQCLFCCQSTY